jgi:cytochrome c
MKRTILLMAGISISAAVFISCGGGSKSDDAKSKDAYDDYEIAKPETAEPKKESSADVIAEGKALVDANDCKTCHHPTNKLIGPPHKDVALKYEFTEANVKLLATKIINGGSGVWGDIMMSGHPNVSQADAEKMARYVLSLDGETEH